jgi:hypothetical protein
MQPKYKRIKWSQEEHDQYVAALEKRGAKGVHYFLRVIGKKTIKKP